MANKGTRTNAFASYGIVLKNVNWSLSGRSADEKTVALSIWQDELTGADGELVYDRPSWGDWYDGPGKKFLFEDLAWARDKCGGIVRIVRSIRKQGDREPVQISGCHAAPDLVMRVTHMDPEKGAFRLEQVV